MNTQEKSLPNITTTDGGPVDLNKCKPGDRLLSVHGEILQYIGKVGGEYPHEVRYSNGHHGTRLDNGWVYKKNRLPEDHDIVAILPAAKGTQ